MGYLLAPVLAVLCSSLALAQAQEESVDKRPFMRFAEQPDGGHLDVMAATYRRGDVTVTLQGAVHIADAEHYAALQKRFEAFDVLLYELIADTDLKPYPGMERDTDDWFSAFQVGMGKGMQLAHQVDSVDYRKPNFVHADMTPEEWQEALDKIGKSLIGELMAGGPPEPDREAEANKRQLDIVGAFRSGRGAHEVRIMGARMIAEPDKTNAEPTVLIEGRNKKCLGVLEEQLALGKKKIGIYYGAAHMANMEQQLTQEMGFTKVSEEWVLAWDCSASRFPAVEKGLNQKRYRAKQDAQELLDAVDAWRKENVGAQPTWALLREAQKDGKLPGRADGKDPWGREYVLRSGEAGFEVRCLGSDGVIDTEDDVFVAAEPTIVGKVLWGAREALRKNIENAEAEAMLQAAKTSSKSLHDAVSLYYLKYGKLPQLLSDLLDREARGGAVLEALPKDPWGGDYVLRGTDKKDFFILSAGPDGKLDTEDDISSAKKKR
jgi:hypothetical protein